MLKVINFCGDFATSVMYAENSPSLCSSVNVVRILSHVLKSFEKFGNGMVGPASNALLLLLFFQVQIMKRTLSFFFLKSDFLENLVN